MIKAKPFGVGEQPMSSVPQSVLDTLADVDTDRQAALVERYLLDNAQRAFLTIEGLSVLDLLNGRFSQNLDIQVSLIFAAWNQLLGEDYFTTASAGATDGPKPRSLDAILEIEPDPVGTLRQFALRELHTTEPEAEQFAREAVAILEGLRAERRAGVRVVQT
jgi:hypothetical protein